MRTSANAYLRNERKDAFYELLHHLRCVQLRGRLDVQALLLRQAMHVAGGWPLGGFPGDADEYGDGRAVESAGQVELKLCVCVCVCVCVLGY